jgi:hypothetical protein
MEHWSRRQLRRKGRCYRKPAHQDSVYLERKTKYFKYKKKKKKDWSSKKYVLRNKIIRDIKSLNLPVFDNNVYELATVCSLPGVIFFFL